MCSLGMWIDPNYFLSPSVQKKWIRDASEIEYEEKA